ncbi:helix-turn-helix domain-containing protein [Actinacidiphila yeochonensis]|uniref:helix-turn-helix domain-containing protein n=1 Tax=Actinacidiphila yeochonensis TaxID=89050 RepID=UPI0006914D5B|nr:helix-turn-helix domain-containing protein [Actinacidiphila yeochonensis]
MEITDPRAIRALAHPLRLDLLELLAASGPATAAQCGRALGIPQANCSFHLRQLARYGYVEEAGPGADRRERQWRLPDERPAMRFTAAEETLRRQLERTVVERALAAILEHAEHREQEPPEWRAGTGIVSAVTAVTAEEAGEIERKWQELLAPYLSRSAEASAPEQSGLRHIRYFMAATPLTGVVVEAEPSAGTAEEEEEEEGGAEEGPREAATGRAAGTKGRSRR